MKAMRIAEVAEKLGVSVRTVRKYVHQGKIKPDYRVGNTMFFTRYALDAFSKEWQNRDGMTIEDVIGQYQITEDGFNWHLREERIQPIAKRGRSHVYKNEDVEWLAVRYNWSKRSESVSLPSSD